MTGTPLVVLDACVLGRYRPEESPLRLSSGGFTARLTRGRGATAARRPDSREGRGFAPARRGSYLHRALGGRCATPPASPRSSYPLRAGRPAGVRGSSAATATTRRSPGVTSRPASAGSPSRPRHEQTRPRGWAETAARGRLRGVEAALHGATPRRLPEHQRAEAALKGHEIGSKRNMNVWLGQAWSWPSRRRYADPASFLLTPARWELQRSDHALPATGSARFLGRWWPTSDLQDGLGPLVHL